MAVSLLQWPPEFPDLPVLAIAASICSGNSKSPAECYSRFRGIILVKIRGWQPCHDCL